MPRTLLRASVVAVLLLALPTSAGFTFYGSIPVTLGPDGPQIGAGVRTGPSIDVDDNDACGQGAQWDEEARTATGTGSLGRSEDGTRFDQDDWSFVHAYRSEIVSVELGGAKEMRVRETCDGTDLPFSALGAPVELVELEATGPLWFGVTMPPGQELAPYTLTYTFHDNDAGRGAQPGAEDAPDVGPGLPSLVAVPVTETSPDILTGALTARRPGPDHDYYGVSAPVDEAAAPWVLGIVVVSFRPDCAGTTLAFRLYEADGVTPVAEHGALACGGPNTLACLSVGPAQVQAALARLGGPGTGYTLQALTSPVGLVDVEGATALVVDLPATEPSDTLEALRHALDTRPGLPPWCDAESARLAPALALLAEASTEVNDDYRKVMGPVRYVLGKLPPVLA